MHNTTAICADCLAPDGRSITPVLMDAAIHAEVDEHLRVLRSEPVPFLRLGFNNPGGIAAVTA